MPKILYITSPLKHLQVSGCLNNYLNDLLFYGLTELHGDDVVASNVITPLYRSLRHKVDPRLLWGRGFTGCWLLDGEPFVEQDIRGKIADRHYDVVIYGSVRDCDDYLDIVAQAYPPNRVLLVDGNDDQLLHSAFQQFPYFKRELIHTHPNLRPISFAIPTSKMCSAEQLRKTRTFATCVPGNTTTYVFETEEEYYADYQSSLFAFTMRKHGWDCLRHYEIIANRCIPLFYDIQSCPRLTMVRFPRELCEAAIALFQAFHPERYIEVEQALFMHCSQHLTTRELGKYVMECVA